MIVKVWIARFLAMVHYLNEKPDKVSEMELDYIRDSAAQVISKIDEILVARGKYDTTKTS